MDAKVLKVSESGKSMFVRVQLNAYDTKGIAGYCANPTNAKVGDIIKDFPTPSGIESRVNPETGEIFTTKTGEPLSFLVWG